MLNYITYTYVNNAPIIGIKGQDLKLTPWRRVHPEKITVFQLVNKIPAFYGTWSFITDFIQISQWFLY
jgi:hypothetical protein